MKHIEYIVISEDYSYQNGENERCEDVYDDKKTAYTFARHMKKAGHKVTLFKITRTIKEKKELIKI